MPQAILTKFIPASRSKYGARIKAVCDRGSITISKEIVPDGKSPDIYAARELCRKFMREDMKRGELNSPWANEFVSGGLPNGTVAHVFIN